MSSLIKIQNLYKIYRFTVKTLGLIYHSYCRLVCSRTPSGAASQKLVWLSSKAAQWQATQKSSMAALWFLKYQQETGYNFLPKKIDVKWGGAASFYSLEATLLPQPWSSSPSTAYLPTALQLSATAPFLFHCDLLLPPLSSSYPHNFMGSSCPHCLKGCPLSSFYSCVKAAIKQPLLIYVWGKGNYI